MINREVSYQRNITGSFMKIPISRISEFDEKLILKTKLPGLVPIERCYVNGRGEYWYQISGKQSLDTYTKVQSIGVDFIEKVILSICSEIEILEWNLFDINCILLEPELIFISNLNHEILFCLYPEKRQDLHIEFQQLMEYLLTRINHQDEAAVKMAYDIYEKTLEEEYNLLDIRDFIIESRKSKEGMKQENFLVEEKKKEGKGGQNEESMPVMGGWREHIKKYEDMKEDEKPHNFLEQIWNELLDYWNSIRELINKYKPEKGKEEEEEEWTIEPEEYEEKIAEVHPTICIGAAGGKEEGILLYEGSDAFPDMRIEKESYMVGKGKDAQVLLQKETISRHHAKISKKDDGFYIEDLNSTNGTYVNESLLSYKEKRKLESNDIIRFADVKYRFL